MRITGQGCQSYDFGAVVGPHSQWQKVSFFPIYRSTLPKIVQSEKSKVSVRSLSDSVLYHMKYYILKEVRVSSLLCIKIIK